MIIKAKERGGGAQLARYLLTMRDNDHVELHEVRGFVSDDLRGAFCEADAIAAGTRCQNHLFSISLNPPQDATVTAEEFEAAANEVERKLGLEGQPRVIVFHEKDGRTLNAACTTFRTSSCRIVRYSPVRPSDVPNVANSRASVTACLGHRVCKESRMVFRFLHFSAASRGQRK